MNICIISPAFPSKKNPVINIFIYRQAKELAKRGHKVFVVGGDTESRVEGNMTVYARPNAIKSVLLALKVMLKIPKESFWLLKNVGLKGAVGRLSLVQITCDLLKKEKIDVIDGHYEDYGAVVAYLTSILCKTRYVCTCHRSTLGEISGGRRDVIRVALENANCVMVPSHSLANDAKKYCPKKLITVVHNAVDLNLFKPMNKKVFKRKTILSIGRLDKIKGYEFLLEAMKRVLEINKDVDLLIVGRGPEEHNIKKIAKNLDISDNVIFIDFIPSNDLPVYYSSSEFFALATLCESFGIVFIEAMACGTPVVSTNVGAVPEVVGEGGILVEPRNPDQLAEAMLKLLNDENLRQELSKKALEQAKKFSIENRINKIEKIYKKVMQNENLLHI